MGRLGENARFNLLLSVQTIGLLRHSLNDLIALRNQRDKQIFFFCPDALSGVTQVSTGGKTASYSSFSHGCAICGAGIFRPKLGVFFDQAKVVHSACPPPYHGGSWGALQLVGVLSINQFLSTGTSDRVPYTWAELSGAKFRRGAILISRLIFIN